MTDQKQPKREDHRIAYGANCNWWDSIWNVGSTATHPAHAQGITVFDPHTGGVAYKGRPDIPCCPHCGGMLLEVENEAAWYEGVPAFEMLCGFADGEYRAFLEWGRGKCLRAGDAPAIYEQVMGKPGFAKKVAAGFARKQHLKKKGADA